VIEASGMENIHILWVDPVITANKVAAMPNVLTATVEIAWPNHAYITVSEREPVLVWDQAGDRFWVDATGQLMQARQYKSELLLILSQQTENLNPGDRIEKNILEGALQLRNLRPNINVLYYKSDTGLSYLDGRNWEALFGVGTDMNQKLVVYETLVDELMARDLQPEYISVINKEKPFYLLATPAQ
jgi:cell division septal protein FtsQ